MTTYVGQFAGEELLNRISSIVQICIVVPALILGALGLRARRLWGALATMTGLGVFLAWTWALPATAIVLGQAGVCVFGYCPDGGSIPVFILTTIVIPLLISLWGTRIGLTVLKRRDLL